MKKETRIVLCLMIVIFLAIFCLYRCLSEKEDAETLQKVIPMETGTPVPTRIITIPGQSSVSDPQGEITLMTIRYYTVLSSGGANQSAEAVVQSDTVVNCEFITELVLDALEDEEIEIGSVTASVSDDICTLDFEDGILGFFEKNSVIERNILDAFAMSILDNCTEIRGVSFSINGDAYKSSNISLSEGEVYLKR